MTAKWIASVLGFVAIFAASCTTQQAEPGGTDAGVSTHALGTSSDAECIWEGWAGHEYWFCRDKQSWTTARDRCREMDLELATINSAEENAFIEDRLEKDSWIGANDRDAEGSWQWVAGGMSFWEGEADGAPVNGAYANWKSYQPNDFFGEDCAEIESSGGEWHDESCHDIEGYVCESQGDTCPDDPDKAGPGQCGCGVPDTDSDGDGKADCVDECPDDPERIEPGDCGCASDPRPAGTPCRGGVCYSLSTCDGNGTCGDPSECRPGHGCSFAQHAGARYWYCDKDRSFDTARERCQSVGMDLAVVDSATEDAFLDGLIDEDAYMGASDRGKRGVWVWEPTGDQFWAGDDDGSSIAGWYSNWELDELDDYGDHCLVKEDHGGEWETGECDHDEAYVCEDHAAGGDVAISDGNPPIGPYLSPVLECVADLPNRGLSAVWGYNNGTQETTTRAVGPDDNAFAPGAADRGQPTTFEPGRRRGVLATRFTGEIAWTLNGRTAVASSASRSCSVEVRGSEGERTAVAVFDDGTEITVFDEQEQLQDAEQAYADCLAACDSDSSQDQELCESNCAARRKAGRYWYGPRQLSYQRCFTHCERQEAAACPGSLDAEDCIQGCRHGTLHRRCEEEWQELARCWDHATEPIECDPISGAPIVPDCNEAAFAELVCAGPNPM